MADKKRSFFERLITPDYDELALYSMSYICLLFFLVNNPPDQWSLRNISIQSESLGLIAIFLFFIVGMFLSFYHAFSDRKKTLIEKKLMLFFAVIICGFSGIWGGTYVLINSSGWLTVFPVWNIISGWILLSGLKDGEITENCISDENIGLEQVASSTVIVSLVFFFCYLGFKLNWAATFSICIAWATTFNNSINAIFLKLELKQV